MAYMFVTRTKIDEGILEKVVETLNVSLADCITAQAMIKFAHWNVKGETFWQTHKLFDEIFEKVLEITDDIGERIGSLGGIAEGLPETVIDRNTLGAYAARNAGAAVLAHIEAMANLIADLGNGFTANSVKCDQLGDRVTADCYDQWASEVQHKLYFLEAHLRP